MKNVNVGRQRPVLFPKISLASVAVTVNAASYYRLLCATNVPRAATDARHRTVLSLNYTVSEYGKSEQEHTDINLSLIGLLIG